MPTRKIMLQVIQELQAVFPQLHDNQVYLVPKIMLLPSMQMVEIQVAEGSSRVLDHDGTVRREDFQVVVGILMKYRFDSDGRFHQALAHLEKSIWLTQTTAVNTLDGNNLDQSILRPLQLTERSAVEQLGKDTLVKQLVFIGGINVAWTDTSI